MFENELRICARWLTNRLYETMPAITTRTTMARMIQKTVTAAPFVYRTYVDLSFRSDQSMTERGTAGPRRQRWRIREGPFEALDP